MVKKNTIFTEHLPMTASATQIDETSIKAIGIPKERSILPENWQQIIANQRYSKHFTLTPFSLIIVNCMVTDHLG